MVKFTFKRLKTMQQEITVNFHKIIIYTACGQSSILGLFLRREGSKRAGYT